MYHQIFAVAQQFFIKKRKYFSGNKKKRITIFNYLFLKY
ncbi:hypothetical protein A7T52_11200 [Salmonella enterica subsp. diarizonae serovar 60:r:e,n,x,z15]|uniref:Uncharacterized protein n=1 Tax=Salmonella enterica TaxID=28901 RepID=A0A3F3IVV4_SALER|nr:hypothetical protein SED60170_11826 [Salmonella enterica subsp. diarizonae serovar 60:r:e,n,x,z15 str. 01-0170]OHF48962.1 hypothetical protein A7S32_12950 [Salmonella enterica subsp. diarizonae serovar 59:[k]:z35]OHF64739.1 hypothetical protein A7S96_13195 [Salmonella enterica subsp. diarizonae serovar 60:r:e,n,x,z15]OHG28597.1 hypothetical protein A7T58_16750 [Salmonella enterica subsp. diarizonae serovar 16:z10:e,n,x,z15]OHH13834.1 hypothetical protein A7R90_10455 [Salmonella enterica]OHK